MKTAIRGYLQSHRYKDVTRLLNEVYQTEDSGLEANIQHLQFDSLSQNEKSGSINCASTPSVK